MRDPFNLKNTILGAEERGEAYDSELAYEESLPGSVSLPLSQNPASRFRAAALTVLILAAAAALAGRLYYLSIARHGYYRGIAEGNRLRVEYIAAPRGTIYDANGLVIAGNRPSFELVASPLDLPADAAERGAVIEKASFLIAMPPADIEAALLAAANQAGFQSVLIKQDLGRDEALVLSERIAELPGFRVVSLPIRDYALAAPLSHAVGYVGKLSPEEYEKKAGAGYRFNDSIGKTGLEQVYEAQLRGTFGERQVEVDARGAVKRVFGEKPAMPGKDLPLNIDLGLQEKLHEALSRQLQNIGRKKAAAIAMDPGTGAVLAYISLPGYDSNLFASGISATDYQKLAQDPAQPLFDRAIRGTYPPGSTVKPMVAGAALQEGVVSERTIVDDTGFILIPNVYGGPDYYFYGYNRAGLGPVDVRKAIALSSDIFFYAVGGGYEKIRLAGLGISRLAEYYRRFRLDQKLGIDLPGESAGLVPTPEWKKTTWYLGDTYHASIGQGDLLVTPLHVLSWVSAIAAGKIYEPHIAKTDPKLIGELGIDEKNLQIVREGMRQTVTAGTAKSLQSVGMNVAGKTGTAQFDARNLSRTHAWFAGYAPYEDPKIAIVVLIEDGGEGSAAAVPVAREALTWWAKNRIK